MRVVIGIPGRHLGPILLISLILNLCGIQWGLPQGWQNDEVTWRAQRMVDARSMNPGHFAYGALHDYVLVALVVLPVASVQALVRPLGVASDWTWTSIVRILARAVSAFLATATVYLTYLIGRMLFGHRAGLWSAGFLAVTMGLVNFAHFATTDIPSLFWFMLSCTMSAKLMMDKSWRWYLLAGLCAGLGAGVKYVAGIAIIPLLCAHVLGARGPHGKLALAVAAAGVGFVLGNPMVILSFAYVVGGFLQEQAFNATRGADSAQPDEWPLISNLVNALGVPLFALSLAGALWSVWLVFDPRSRPKVLFLWSMIIPYLLIVASQTFLPMRYTITLLPGLLVLAGRLADDTLRHRHVIVRITATVVLIITVGYSALYAGAADLYFINDSRVLTRRWVTSHAPEGTRIELTSHGPSIPTDRYVVVVRPHGETPGSPLQSPANAMRYRALRARSDALVSWIQSFGIDDIVKQPPYRSLHDQSLDRIQRQTSSFDMGLRGLESRAPDLLILSNQYIQRFRHDQTSPEGQLYHALLAGTTRYVKVAELQYRFLPWIDPKVEMVNPKIHIFRRDGPTANSRPQ